MSRPVLEAFEVTCSRCGKPFIRELRGGKWVPLNPDGTRHDCGGKR